MTTEERGGGEGGVDLLGHPVIGKYHTLRYSVVHLQMLVREEEVCVCVCQLMEPVSLPHRNSLASTRCICTCVILKVETRETLSTESLES